MTSQNKNEIKNHILENKINKSKNNKNKISEDKVEIKLPVWDSNSHKGECGRVLVIGGSPKYYGAPIITALAAEAAGADLISVFMPSMHIEAAKLYSLNLILHTFHHEEMGIHDVQKIHKNIEKCDVIIIGNGIGYGSSNTAFSAVSNNIDVQKGILSILSGITLPVVLDGEALFPAILKINPSNMSKWIITPHREEFRRLFNMDVTLENVVKCSDKYGITICVKGCVDYIAAPGILYQNTTGVPQMRVGGTGDALAGIIGAYYSMNMDAFNAAKSGAFLWGKCGEHMLKYNFSFSAYKMIAQYPSMINELIKQNKTK